MYRSCLRSQLGGPKRVLPEESYCGVRNVTTIDAPGARASTKTVITSFAAPLRAPVASDWSLLTPLKPSSKNTALTLILPASSWRSCELGHILRVCHFAALVSTRQSWQQHGTKAKLAGEIFYLGDLQAFGVMRKTNGSYLPPPNGDKAPPDGSVL
jgi:hypothetical protein